MDVVLVHQDTSEQQVVQVSESDTVVTFCATVTAAMPPGEHADLRIRFRNAHTDELVELDPTSEVPLLDYGLTQGCEVSVSVCFATLAARVRDGTTLYTSLDEAHRAMPEIAIAGSESALGISVFEDMPQEARNSLDVMCTLLRRFQRSALSLLASNDCLTEGLLGDKHTLLRLIDSCPFVLEHAPEEQLDADVVHAAVSQWGRGMQIVPASSPIRADRQVAEAAIRNDGMALAYLPEFRGCREMVRLAVGQNSNAMKEVSPELRDDASFIRELVEPSPRVLLYCSAEIRGDKAFFREHFEAGNGGLLEFAARSVQSDPDLVLLATRHGTHNLLYADTSLRVSKQFQKRVAANNRAYKHSIGQVVDVSGFSNRKKDSVPVPFFLRVLRCGCNQGYRPQE